MSEIYMHQSSFLLSIILLFQTSITLCSHTPSDIDKLENKAQSLNRILLRSLISHNNYKKAEIIERGAQDSENPLATINSCRSCKERIAQFQNLQKIKFIDTTQAIYAELQKLPKSIQDEFHLQPIKSMTDKEFYDGIEELYQEINHKQTQRYQHFDENIEFFKNEDQSFLAQAWREVESFEDAFKEKLRNCISDIKTDDGL